MRILSTQFGLEPGEYLVLTPGILMERWENEQGEDCRFISDPGFPEDDQAPDPYFEGLTGDQVIAELFRIEQEEWYQEQQYRLLYEQMYRDGDF